MTFGVRRAMRAACIALAAFAAFAATHAAAQRAAGPSIAGTWFPENPTETLRTTGGAIPPLTPAGKTLYEQRTAARRAGDVSFDRASWCASPGLPRIMFIPYPLEIVVDPRRIAILSGWYRRYRVIDMSGEPLIGRYDAILLRGYPPVCRNRRGQSGRSRTLQFPA